MKVYIVVARDQDGTLYNMAAHMDEGRAIADGVDLEKSAYELGFGMVVMGAWVEEFQVEGEESVMSLAGQCAMAEALKFAFDELMDIATSIGVDDPAQLRKQARSKAATIQAWAEQIRKDEKSAG